MKKRGLIAGCLVLIAALAVIAVTQNSSETETSSQEQAGQATSNQEAAGVEPQASETQERDVAEVEIVDFAFAPAELTIAAGTTVVWKNLDTARHDVTPDEPSPAFEGSELLAQNETYRFTFDTPGVYTYFCGPHPYMRGTITVTE